MEHEQSGDTTEEDRRYRVPRIAAINPDSKSPNSVDAPMNNLLNEPTLPRIASSVTNWVNVERIFTVTMLLAPMMNSVAGDKWKPARNAEHCGCQAEHCNRGKEPGPSLTGYGPAGLIQGHQAGARSRRASQQSESDAAEMKNISGIDRKQGCRATKQDPNEIQGN